MINLSWIEENPDIFDKIMTNRTTIKACELISLSAKRKSLITEIDQLKAERNSLPKSFSPDHLDRAVEIKSLLSSLEPKLQEALNELSSEIDKIPNIPSDDVPPGKDESGNIIIREIGNIPNFNFIPKDHVDLGEPLGMNFKNAADISGSRFVILKSEIAKLHRGLVNYMIDRVSSAGYTEYHVPVMVKDKAMYGTGQLPKFENDLYKTNEHWLIPTAEVYLTNMVSDKIVDTLPLHFTAYTECFRAESGSAGRDTRGMIRQHQFGKVEIVSICREEESDIIHENMVELVSNMLCELNLPHRIVLLCDGDMGFSAAKTYDIEVYLPTQGYREISSISNCKDFQGRRMNARYRNGKRTTPVHTLNGSALAVGRTIVALLENFQDEHGNIHLPECLHRYVSFDTIRRI